MKKILVLVALVCVFVLASCGHYVCPTYSKADTPKSVTEVGQPQNT